MSLDISVLLIRGCFNIWFVEFVLNPVWHHRGEAMYISVSGSNDIPHKEMVFNGLVIHNLIMIIYISYGITFTTSLPKLMNIAPL